MVLEQAADLENRSARIVLMQFLITGLQVYLNVSPEELAKVIPVKYNLHVGDGVDQDIEKNIWGGGQSRKL